MPCRPRPVHSPKVPLKSRVVYELPAHRDRQVKIGKMGHFRWSDVKNDPISILSELVAIGSVNPMGKSECGPPYGESRLTTHLEGVLRNLGLVVVRQQVEPGRENVVARLDVAVLPRDGGKIVLLDAHQDTVPVTGMTIDPFRAEVRDGRLFGRGACDTKGGMAAMLAAMARLAKERPGDMPTVVMSFTVNEEWGFTGASALPEAWADSASSIIPRRPDAALVAEPTGLDVGVAHKGVARGECRVSGRAAHSATPESGENAIYRMGRVLAAIEHFAREIVPRGEAHRLCGPATLSVGTIHGGVAVNVVPDRCVIEIDRRLSPGETPEDARRQLVDYLDETEAVDFPVEHGPLFLAGPSLSDDGNGELADRLGRICREVAGQGRPVGVSYATNGAFYAAAGIPTVVCGPGSIEQAHTDDEWISVDEVRQATEIFYRFCRQFS